MEYRILGPIEVLDDGRPLRLGGPRERSVLAYLLLHAGQVVPADRLVDEIWGGGSADAARRSLRVRIAELRKALRTGMSAGERIAGRAGGYVLELCSDTLDLREFERLTEQGARHLYESRPESAAAALRDALALWRGPALTDLVYESWAAPAIGRLEELRLAALERRIEADLSLGRDAELIGEIEALVGEHPLRERLRALLMLALYRAGRQAEALSAYRAARQMLVDELGIEPGSQLQHLEKAVLRQDPSLDPPRRGTVERSILVVSRRERSLPALLALGEPLASHPPRELILARTSHARDLARTAASLGEEREALLSRGVATRAAAFTSAQPGIDLVRLSVEQDVDLLLVDTGDELLDDLDVQEILGGAPCDVAVLVGHDGLPRSGPVLVPFTGAEHDWSAIEIAAWIARAEHRVLKLAGPVEEDRDASRVLARASLAVQRALGVAAEPLLVEPGAGALVPAAEDAALVVVGLSERWRREGLGPVRLALAREARTPTLLVRRGLRPGGLAPPENHTRFTWSVGPVSP